MIINKDFYECPKCKKLFSFDTSKPFTTICEHCNVEMNFYANLDCDTELAAKRAEEKRKEEERNSPFYKIECPYCHGTDTKKITSASRAVSITLFGISSKKLGKQFHCNRCKADF